MKNLLLGIIAINLTFISANLALRSVEPVQAEIDGMDYYDLKRDRDFRRAVKDIVDENCRVDIATKPKIKTWLYCDTNSRYAPPR
jgi:hypothetical protein